MDDERVEELVRVWISENSRDSIDNACEGMSKADEVFFMSSIRRPELCWRLIALVVELSDDLAVLGAMAAGPLEELLAQHGANFIDRVEALANSNDRMKIALTGLYQNAMPDDVWERVMLAQVGASRRLDEPDGS